MTDRERLFDIVDGLYDQYMELYRKIVTHETYSTDKEAIDSLVAFLCVVADHKGYEHKVVPFERAGNGLLLTLNPDAKLPGIALCGHMDTVHPKGSFKEPVFRIEGNKVFGPGVFDMKGGLIIGLLVMETLSKYGFKDRPVKFIFVPDEERSEGLSGEPGKKFIIDSAKGCAAALTLEGGTDPKGVTVGRKGSIRYHVTVQGVAAHAGSSYAKGRSAIKEASHKILDIEAPSIPDQITYNCGMITGGTSPNTVPEFCEFMLYNRYWTEDQYKELRAHVEGILAKQFIPDTKTTFEVIGERYPMEASEKNIALAEELSRVSQECGFGPLEAQRKNSGSDACYTAMAGVPSVCSIGPIGENAHMLSEFSYADSISKRAKLISAFIAGLRADFGVQDA